MATVDLGKVSTTPQGNYNSNIVYERLDIVSFDGSSYLSLIDNNSSPLGDTTAWQLSASKGETGATGLQGEKGETGYKTIDPYPLLPTDPAPTVDGWYKPLILSVSPGTNYPNAGNLKAIEGYETLFNKTGSVWTKSETKLPQVEIDGVVAENNPDAVSGGAVYSRYSNLINLGSVPVNFTLAEGSINITTGLPNTSVNWLRTLPVACDSSTLYSIQGYGMDTNTITRRVFFYNGSTFLSYIPSGSATTFEFTTPATCTNFMIQVVSGTDVGVSPSTSPFNSSLKIMKGTAGSDYLKAEKLQGTIVTPQIQNLEKARVIDNSEFSDKFDFTNQVNLIDYKSIGMTGSSGITHLNFAISKETNISVIEAKIKAIDSNGSIRLGFGDVNASFQLIKTAASSSVFDVYMMSRYGVTSIGSLNIGTAMTLVVGDRIKLFRSGLNMNAYINDVFVGNINLLNQGALSGNMEGVVGFRDNVQFWQAESIKLKKRKAPYIHISVDDSINVFRELFINNPASIFDNARLAVYKEMHDKYGACFSLFCFYQNSAATFNLSQMPATWKAEFIANSHWLKIGFHGVDATTDYTTISLTDGVEHYTRIINEINRFAGYSSIDNMPRFSQFKGNKPLYIELKKYGLVGVVTADDARTDNSSLTVKEIASINVADDYYNYEMGFYFVRTSPRLDTTNAVDVVNLLKTENNSYNTKNVFEMFYHEGRESTTEGKEMIEAMCKYAFENGIRFDFPQNNIIY